MTSFAPAGNLARGRGKPGVSCAVKQPRPATARTSFWARGQIGPARLLGLPAAVERVPATIFR